MRNAQFPCHLNLITAWSSILDKFRTAHNCTPDCLTFFFTDSVSLSHCQKVFARRQTINNMFSDSPCSTFIHSLTLIHPCINICTENTCESPTRYNNMLSVSPSLLPCLNGCMALFRHQKTLHPNTSPSSPPLCEHGKRRSGFERNPPQLPRDFK